MRRPALAALLICLSALPAAAGSLPNLRTGGFDYDERVAENDQVEATWVATHHDWVIGMQQHGAGTTFDRMHEANWDRLKAGNPNAVLIGYVPFQTMQPWMSTWMEAWARAGGRDPEDLYCHYEVDTTVLDRDGVTRTFPGYPLGTAASRAASRLMSTWWYGSRPNVCPQSALFREAYAALVAEAVTIDAAERKYLDGVLLDSFNCTVDSYYNLHLENTVEMRALGKTTFDAARAQWNEDAVGMIPALRRAIEDRTGRPGLVVPNAGDADDVYSWYKDTYVQRFAPGYDLFAVEYLITPGFARTTRIERLKQFYLDMTHPTRPVTFFFTSHTTNTTGIPFNFTQFILATHQLIAHPNGLFSYHVGSPSWYGAIGGRFANSHWHPNLEVDLGRPVGRAGADAWGTPGTDRFFVIADGGSAYKVLAREFERGLVVAHFGQTGGWSNIGLNPVTVPLGGTFRRLEADNSLSAPITTITLGGAEGAILLRDTPPRNAAPSAPAARRGDVN